MLLTIFYFLLYGYLTPSYLLESITPLDYQIQPTTLYDLQKVDVITDLHLQNAMRELRRMKRAIDNNKPSSKSISNKFIGDRTRCNFYILIFVNGKKILNLFINYFLLAILLNSQ